jgi:cell fate regulator YaaT (PSP1 superfamily)
MVRVTPIKMQAGTKVLWFDPGDKDVKADDHVIVKTERGTEFGTATADIMEVSDELVANLKSPLKPVIRIATEEDVARAEDLAAQGEAALSVFKEFAEEANDQMRPVMVEFLFDGDKAVFYFEAEERVDFRDLVRKLAGHFHVRVDMRQIGVRDGARLVGGLGHCGQELCCKRLGGEFSPVSIRMAKEQNLSLNPQKISGCCGRLMCCLRYEYETYKEVNSRAPKHGAKIQVPGGVARVTEINVPLERVTLKLEDGKSIKVPLAEMEYNGEGKRPTGVSEDVFEKYASPDPLDVFGSTTFEVTTFNGNEKLANNESRKARKAEREKEDSHRKPRRRRRGSSDSQAQAKNDGSQSHSNQGQKKSSSQKKNEGQSRRSRRGSGKGQKSQQQNNREQRNDQRKQNNTDSNAKRPGRKSSGVRNAPRKQQGEHAAGNVNAGKQGEVAHRKPRRRRRKAQGEGTNNEQQ